MQERTRELRRAFRHLKRGVFPPDSIDEFTFGRSSELKLIEKELDNAIVGPGRYHFVEGTYGQGKSHFLKAFEAIALRKNFAVSWVTLDGNNHALNHPTRYFHSFLENLRLPGGEQRGLAQALNRWLQGPERTTLLRWAAQDQSRLGKIIEGKAFPARQNERTWYDHDYFVESRDIAFNSGKDYFNVVSFRMQQTASLLRAVGLSGMVYLFDEVETVATLLHGTRQRFLAYELLNLLLDDRKHAHCLFAFAVTPDFSTKISADKLLKPSYQGVYSGACRFIQRWQDGSVDRIRLARLGRSDLISICGHLRKCHETVFGKPASGSFSDSFVISFVNEAQRRNLGIRDLVKSFVNLLELSEQYEDVIVPDLLGLVPASAEYPPSLQYVLDAAASLQNGSARTARAYDEIIEFCRKRNLSVIDNRYKNGALWVTHFSWDGPVADKLKNEGFRFKQGKGWWIT